MDKINVKEQLDAIDEAIELTSKTRDAAIKAQTECSTRIDMAQKALEKYGVTPENAMSKIEELEDKIESLVIELKGQLPIDLLIKLNKLPEGLKERLR